MIKRASFRLTISNPACVQRANLRDHIHTIHEHFAHNQYTLTAKNKLGDRTAGIEFEFPFTLAAAQRPIIQASVIEELSALTNGNLENSTYDFKVQTNSDYLRHGIMEILVKHLLRETSKKLNLLFIIIMNPSPEAEALRDKLISQGLAQFEGKVVDKREFTPTYQETFTHYVYKILPWE